MLQLALNAVMHGGGRMIISGAVRRDVLELSVDDFGSGVPDEAKTQVFRPLPPRIACGRADRP
jgi:signal transduction histidine kinase